MSIEAMNWALNQKVGSAAAKSVLLILANRADQRGICWPGLTGISEQTELSRRAVINNIQKLEDAGFLVIKTRKQPQTNLYQLNMVSSERGALVNEVHSEPDSLEVVNEVHLPSERGAPEPSLTQSKPKSYRAAKRVPPKWEMSENGAKFSAECGMDADSVMEQLAQFRDHEFKTAKKDWDAAWRTWCRNWKRWGKHETHHNRSFDTKLGSLRKRAGLDSP